MQTLSSKEVCFISGGMSAGVVPVIVAGLATSVAAAMSSTTAIAISFSVGFTIIGAGVALVGGYLLSRYMFCGRHVHEETEEAFTDA